MSVPDAMPMCLGERAWLRARVFYAKDNGTARIIKLENVKWPNGRRQIEIDYRIENCMGIAKENAFYATKVVVFQFHASIQ